MSAPPGRPRALRLAKLDELEVEVEKLVAGGEGLGRFEGIPILVPRSAPGDRVRVRLVERRPDYGRAEIVELLEPGPGRRQAPCPFFARCGGCDLQHLEDELQSELRVAAAAETLRRLGGVDTERLDAKLVSSAAWGYRLRTQLQTRELEGGSAIGYFARGSRDLVRVDRCPILVPELEAWLEGLARESPGGLPRRLDAAVGDHGALTCAPVSSGLPRGEVTVRLGDFVLGFDARCFFQAHRGLLEPLCEVAVGAYSGGTAYDLYAGVGLLTLPLARAYGRVLAVEGDRIAARHARRNLRRNRLQNAEVLACAVESWIEELPPGAERVVVDPPRSGLSSRVRRALRRLRPEHLTYVSCHPATLARDLAFLGDRYRIEELTYLDLFPQTGHLETVVQLLASS